MLKNYKELKVWQKAYLLSGDLGYIRAGDLEILQRDIGEVERMLKGLIRALEKRPWNP